MNAMDEAKYYLLRNRKEICRRLVGDDIHITYTMRGPNNEIYHWNDEQEAAGIVADSSDHVTELLEKYFASKAGDGEQQDKTKLAIPRLRDVRKREFPATGEFVVVFDDDGLTTPFVTCGDDRRWYSCGVAAQLSWYPLWIPVKELFQFLQKAGE